jgi:hypothetical protein
VSRADRALTAARARAHELPGEWPLVLHMLEGHAPRFFAEQGLGPELSTALDALDAVPTQLAAGLNADEAMLRADARYLKGLRRRTVPPLDEAAARQCLAHVGATEGSLHAWLIGALVGVKVPYVSQSRYHDLYWLTHRVLLGTDYLQRPAQHLTEELAALEQALDSLWQPELADLLGEVLFCLQRAGRDVSAAVERFSLNQRADGAFLDAHCTAVGLLVLAF